MPTPPMCFVQPWVRSPPASATNILAQPIPADLLPLDLLPGDWQLPPQPLERALTQLPKRLVQILLVLLLGRCDLPNDLAPTLSTHT